MDDKKEKTAPIISVGADTEQQFSKYPEDIITEDDENSNTFDGFQREMIRMMDPSYLKTVSMSELYDTVFQSKPPLVEGLLYPGTYIFAGAPKLGKSFLMAQLAYHISTGTPLWNYPVEKARCSIWLLKMITAVCRNVYTECLERRFRTTYTSRFRQIKSAKGLMNSCKVLSPHIPIQISLS